MVLHHFSFGRDLTVYRPYTSAQGKLSRLSGKVHERHTEVRCDAARALLPLFLHDDELVVAFRLLRLGALGSLAVKRRQVGQTAEPKTRRNVSVTWKATGLPGRSRRPASSISPLSNSLVTVDDESTPRTCSIKLRETG